MLALAAGRLDEAEDLIPRALALGERAQPEMVVPVDTMQRFTLCAFRGTLDEIAPAVRELVAEFPARTAFRCALALLDARLGRRAEAKRSLDELVGDDCSALPFDQEWLWGMSLLAETAVLLDDAVSAAILYRTLSPWHALNAVDHPEGIRGSVSRYLGLLAATLGRDDDAMRHFEDAIAMNERMGALPWLAYTQYDYGRLLLARGRRERAEKLLDAALATFRELGMAAPGPPQAKPDALRLARAALGYGGRIVWGRAGDDERLVPLLEEALDALGDEDPGLRAKLLARLAGALRDEHSRERRDRLSREAVEVARHAGDLGALAYALDGRCAAVQGPDVIEESLALATELCELAERTEDRDALAAGYDHRVSALLQLGDIARVEADLGAARRIAEELKQPARLWEVTGIEAMLALAKGRLDEAEQLIPRAFALGERAQPDAAIPVYTLQRYALREFRGGVEELEPEIAALVADYPARPVLRCALAHLHARTGRVAEARQALAELARNDFAALPFDQEWLLAMSMLAEVCVTTGGDDEAAVLYRLLEPWSHLNAADPGEGFRGSVARYLALVALALGRLDDAERHFAAALEMNERMGVRPWVEYTQREYTAAQASRA
jgi:tetratricopeptide (TPR) repeat protein